MKQSILTIVLVLFLGCGALDTGVELTDQKVQAFARVIRQMRSSGQDILGRIQAGSDGSQEYDQLEAIILDAGFESLEEFSKVSMEIAKSMSLVSSNQFMEQLSGLNDQIENQVRDQILESFGDDPEMLAAAMAEFEVQMGSAREAFQAEWDQNEPWARLVLDQLSTVVSSNNAEVIARNMNVIQEIWY